MKGATAMALIQCNFYSEVLRLRTSMTVILPQQSSFPTEQQEHIIKGPYPTLYLLHGMSDDHSAWTRYTLIERYVDALNLAVVIPQVDLSFYMDMAYGNKYWTFLTKEVPVVARSFFPLSASREDNFAAGFSMGGYGAVKWGLRHPEQFAAVASIAGALDVADPELRDIIGDQYRLIFGEKDVKGSEHDLLHLLKQSSNSAAPQPLIYQCCGTDDFLYRDNQTFRAACESTSLQHTYVEHPNAGHDWNYSDARIKDILDWLPIRKL
jgi:putative tributyrin esterase